MGLTTWVAIILVFVIVFGLFGSKKREKSYFETHFHKGSGYRCFCN